MNSTQLFEIGLKKRNGELKESWAELARLHSEGLFQEGEQFRCWVKNRIRSNNSSSNPKTESIISEGSFKDSVEINRDGSQSSNKLVKMSLEQLKDASFLLESHGYNADEWELITAKSNIWNAYSKIDGIMQLYASKISVKPRTSGFSMDKLIEEIRKTPPSYFRTNKLKESNNRLLEIPLFDTHFGISDFDYYKQSQDDAIELIQSKQWKEILFIIGQDMIHNDNFRGQTSSGTIIESVDMIKAWSDVKKFYYPMIEEAINNSLKVKIVYSKGNHDESLSWGFVQLLKERYPEVEFDDSFIERKFHTFEKVFIGITHGDKARKNLHNLFQVEFPMEWAMAKTREIHCGHLHTEDAKDHFGMMVRTLSTRNKTDKWHQDQGFVGAHKRFMLFEYSTNELKTIHYI